MGRPLPCLAIKPEQLTETDLKAFWKAVDEDKSGEITVKEFMVFMRRLQRKRGISTSPKAAVGSVVQKAEVSRSQAKTAKVSKFTKAQFAVLARALDVLTNKSLMMM